MRFLVPPLRSIYASFNKVFKADDCNGNKREGQHVRTYGRQRYNSIFGDKNAMLY